MYNNVISRAVITVVASFFSLFVLLVLVWSFLLSFNIIREAEITQITPETIKIVQLREELVFEADATGLYKSFDGKKVIVNNTGASRLLFEFACLLFNFL